MVRFINRLGKIMAVAVFFCVGLTFLIAAAANSPFSSFSLVEEHAYTFISAQNFLQFGFMNSGFLQDFATSLVPEDHPFVYNHMPPGPDIFTAGMLYVFGDNYFLMRALLLSIALAGFYFYYRFCSLVFQQFGLPGAAFCLLLIGAFSIVGVMERMIYTPYPLLAFLPYILVSKYYEKGNSVYLFTAFLVSTLCAMYLEYSLLSGIIAAWCLTYVSQILPFRFRETVIVFAGFVVGVAAHLVQNYLFMGGDLFLEEIMLVLGNRLVGVPSQAELTSFYEAIGFVHHGSQPVSAAGWFAQLTANFAFPGIRMFILSLAALLASFALYRALLSERAASKAALSPGRLADTGILRLGAWAVGTILCPMVLFPAFAQEVNLRGQGANFFYLAPFIAVLIGIAIRIFWSFLQNKNETALAAHNMQTRPPAYGLDLVFQGFVDRHPQWQGLPVLLSTAAALILLAVNAGEVGIVSILIVAGTAFASIFVLLLPAFRKQLEVLGEPTKNLELFIAGGGLLLFAGCLLALRILGLGGSSFAALTLTIMFGICLLGGYFFARIGGHVPALSPVLWRREVLILAGSAVVCALAFRGLIPLHFSVLAALGGAGYLLIMLVEMAAARYRRFQSEHGSGSQSDVGSGTIGNTASPEGSTPNVPTFVSAARTRIGMIANWARQDTQNHRTIALWIAGFFAAIATVIIVVAAWRVFITGSPSFWTLLVLSVPFAALVAFTPRALSETPVGTSTSLRPSMGTWLLRFGSVSVMLGSVGLGTIFVSLDKLSQVRAVVAAGTGEPWVTDLYDLRDFNGDLFMTNINVPTVGYLTRAPGFGVCNLSAVKESGDIDLYGCKVHFTKRPDFYREQQPSYFHFFSKAALFPGFSDCLPDGTVVGQARGGTACLDELESRLTNNYEVAFENDLVRVFDLRNRLERIDEEVTPDWMHYDLWTDVTPNE